MKPMRQMVCALLAVTLLIPAAAASPGSGNPLWDVQGHWAQKEIQEAVAAGWVDGYPEGSFQPGKRPSPGGVHQAPAGRHPPDPGQRDGG